jgi:arylsulfatase A-like enzyme
VRSLVAGSVLLAYAVGASASEARPRNILLIIADDVGVDSVRVYGVAPNPPRTPNIDALARRGVLFRNAWSNPVCSSTRATILTGRYGFRTGIGFVASSGQSLRDREYTLPEMLALHPEHRYGLAAFGKWHLHESGPWDSNRHALTGPARAGFPYFSGVFQYVVPSYQNWQQLEVMDLGDGLIVANHDTFNTRYNTSEIVDQAATWIRVRESNFPRSPWFVWLAFNAAHSPYHKPPAELHSVDLSKPSIDCENPFPYAEPERVAPCYRAMVEAMDTEIGRLLDKELSAETLRRTTVIFVGDNGTIKEVSSGESDPLQAKGTPYQAGIHVPLIVAGAGVEDLGPNGRESSALVNTTDLFATILELAGMSVADTVPNTFPDDGRDDQGMAGEHRTSQAEAVVLDAHSLAPILRAESSSSQRDFVYAELFDDGTGDPLWPHARAIRLRNGYKLIRFDTQFGISAHDELFSLSDDPFERRNLLASELSPAQREIYRELVARLEGIAESGWQPRGPRPGAASESP